MTLKRARTEKRTFDSQITSSTKWASQLWVVFVYTYILFIFIAIIGGMLELLAFLSLGVGPVVGILAIGGEVVQIARRRRLRVIIDSALTQLMGTLKQGDIPLFEYMAFHHTSRLMKQIDDPQLRAAARFLRHAAMLSTSEPIRPQTIKSPTVQTKLQRTTRDVRLGLRYGDSSRMFEALGALIAIQYHSVGQDEGIEADKVKSNSEIADFLRTAALTIFDKDPGPALRGVKALLWEFKQLYREEESAVPMLILSWSYLKTLELMETPILEDSLLWADKYGKTAYLFLEMAEAFKRKQMQRIVGLIGESYDPNKHVLRFTVDRHLRALGKSLYH